MVFGMATLQLIYKIQYAGCREYAQAVRLISIAEARREEMESVYVPIFANSAHIGGQLQSFDGHVESAS